MAIGGLNEVCYVGGSITTGGGFYGTTIRLSMEDSTTTGEFIWNNNSSISISVSASSS